MPKTIYTDLIGKEFKLGARGPNKVDCWGLCLIVGERVKIIYPKEFTPDNTEQQDEFINKGIDSHFEKIEKPEEYCIVTFKLNPPFVDHCGIVLPGCKKFLHVMEGHHTSVNRLDHKVLCNKIEGFYRLRTSK